MKVTVCDNNFAVTSSNLAIGMQKSADAASRFGVSIDELLGDLTGVMQVTGESGLIAGRALQIIYSRLTTMSPAIGALSDIGVNIHNSNGDLKTATQILDEVALAFQNVSEETKFNTAITLAGSDQLSRFLALVNNRSIAHNATARALGSEGSAMRANATYMESLEARINTMKSAWREFALVMGDTVINDTIIVLTRSLTSLASFSKSVVSNFGLLPPVFGLVATSAALMNKNFRESIISALNLRKGISNLDLSTKTAKVSIQGLGVALKALGASLVVGTIFVAIGYGLEKLIGLFAKNKNEQESYFENLKNNLDEIKDKITSLDVFSKKLASVNLVQSDRLEIYRDLSKILPSVISHFTDENEAIYKNVDAINAEIAAERERMILKRKVAAQDALDELSTKDNNKKAKSSSNKINKLNNELLKAQADYEASNFASDFISKYSLLIIPNQKKINELREKLKQIYKKYNLSGSDMLADLVTSHFDSEKSDIQIFYDNLNKYTDRLNKVNGKLIKEKDMLGDIAYGYKEVFQEMYGLELISNGVVNNELSSFFEYLSTSFVDTNDWENSNLDDLVRRYRKAIYELTQLIKNEEIDFSKMFKENNFDELIKKLPFLESYLRNFMDGINATNKIQQKFSVYDEFGKKIGEISNISEATTLNIQLLDEKFNEETGHIEYIGRIVDAAYKQKLFNEKLETSQKVFHDSSSEVKSLNQTINALNEGQSLSVDTTMDLIQKYPQLASSLSQTTEGYKLSTTALEILKNEKISEAEATINSQINSSKAVILETSERIKAYGVEADVINSLKDAKNESSKLGFGKFYGEEVYTNTIFDDSTKSIYYPNGRSLTNLSKENYQKYKSAIEEEALVYKAIINLGMLKDSGQVLLDMLKSPKYGGASSSSSKNNDEAKFNDTTDTKINSFNSLADAQKRDNEALKNSISDDYPFSKQIEQTKELISGKSREIDLLKDANKKIISEQEKLQSSNKQYDMSKWIDANGNATEKFMDDLNTLKTGTAQDELQKLFDTYRKYDEAVRSNKNSISSLVDENKELKLTHDDLRLSYTQSYLDMRNKELVKYDDELKKAQQRQSIMVEDSPNWIKAQKKILELHVQKREALEAENDWIRERLKQNESAQASEKLTADQVELLTSRLIENSDAWYQSVVAIKSHIDAWENRVKSAAGEAAKAIEDHYKKQNDHVQKALDKDLKAYEDYVNSLKQLINRQDDEQDFQKQRGKLQSEQLEIQKKIDESMADNSWEAISRREDLEKDLLKKKEEIAELELSHARKKRNENLDDLMSNKRKEIEEEKTATEKKWENELKADELYASLKQSLLDNNIEGMRSSLENFSKNILTYMDAIGLSIDKNLISKLSPDEFNTYKSLQDLNKEIGIINDSKPNYTSPTQSAVNNAWQQYLSNKQAAEKIRTPSDAKFQELKKKNDELRRIYNFKDASYDELSKLPAPVFSAETGGMTPSWGSGGKFLFAHEKELILNKMDTTNLLKTIDFTRGIIDKIKQFDFGNAFSKTNLSTANNITYEISNSIYLSGDDRDIGSKVVTSIEKAIRRKGL